MSIDTKCNTCICEYEPGKCSIGKLDKFIKAGAEIEHEDGHAIIKGRACLFHRRSDWKDKQEKSGPDDKSLYDIMRDEVRIDVTAIILFEEGKSFEDLNSTIMAMSSGSIPPVKFIIVDCCSGFTTREVLAFMYSKNYTIPWRLEMVSTTNILRGVDLAVKKTNTRWFITYQAGIIPEADLLEKVDDILNDELLQVVMFKNADNINGLLCLRILYKQIGGNKDDAVQNKIARVCENQNLSRLIMDTSIVFKQEDIKCS